MQAVTVAGIFTLSIYNSHFYCIFEKVQEQSSAYLCGIRNKKRILKNNNVFSRYNLNFIFYSAGHSKRDLEVLFTFSLKVNDLNKIKNERKRENDIGTLGRYICTYN